MSRHANRFVEDPEDLLDPGAPADPGVSPADKLQEGDGASIEELPPPAPPDEQSRLEQGPVPPPRPDVRTLAPDVQSAVDADRQQAGRDGVADALYAAFSRTAPHQQAQPSHLGDLQQVHGAQQADTAAAQERELADPNSQTSRMVRERFRAVPGIGEAFAKNMGTLFDAMPGKMVPGVDAILRSQGAGLKPPDPVKDDYLKAQVDKIRAELTDKANAPGQTAALAAASEKLISKLSPAGQKAFRDLPPALAMEVVKQLEGEQHQETGFSQEVGLKTIDERNRQAAEERAASREDPKLAVTTWSGQPAKAATQQEAEKIRQGFADAKEMHRLAGEIANTVRGKGLQVLPGGDKAKLSSDLKLLQGLMKGPAMLNLGALSSSDFAMLEAITGDPTSFSDYFRGGSDAAVTRLEQLRANLVKGYDTKVSALTRASGAPAAASQRRIVKNPSTGERRFLNTDGSLGEAVR